MVKPAAVEIPVDLIIGAILKGFIGALSQWEIWIPIITLLLLAAVMGWLLRMLNKTRRD